MKSDTAMVGAVAVSSDRDCVFLDVPAAGNKAAIRVTLSPQFARRLGRLLIERATAIGFAAGGRP